MMSGKADESGRTAPTSFDDFSLELHKKLNGEWMQALKPAVIRQDIRTLKNRQSRDGQLVDWLEALDKKFSVESRVDSWLDCSPFVFARYPHLQPLQFFKIYGGKLRFFNSRTPFDEQLSSWERRIAAHPEANLILKDLDNEQRKQLAALVLETVSDLDSYREQEEYLKSLTQRARKLKSQRISKRKSGKLLPLDEKVVEIRHALRELHKTATLQGKAGADYAWFAAQGLQIKPPFESGPSADDLLRRREEIIKSPDYLESPETFCMVRLYWFFRTGCGQSGKESEIRTGLIRNYFWTEFGLKRVKIISRKIFRNRGNDISRGCSAVKLAVSHFRFD
jgi:hypothetical protein